MGRLSDEPPTLSLVRQETPKEKAIEPVSMTAFLRKQNEELKDELALLKGEDLPPYRAKVNNPCRKCGMNKNGSYMTKEGKEVSCYVGPDVRRISAFNPNWWQRLWGRKAKPMRMRRDCPICKAIYYEQTKDSSEDE